MKKYILRKINEISNFDRFQKEIVRFFLIIYNTLFGEVLLLATLLEFFRIQFLIDIFNNKGLTMNQKVFYSCNRFEALFKGWFTWKRNVLVNYYIEYYIKLFNINSKDESYSYSLRKLDLKFYTFTFGFLEFFLKEIIVILIWNIFIFFIWFIFFLAREYYEIYLIIKSKEDLFIFLVHWFFRLVSWLFVFVYRVLKNTYLVFQNPETKLFAIQLMMKIKYLLIDRLKNHFIKGSIVGGYKVFNEVKNILYKKLKIPPTIFWLPLSLFFKLFFFMTLVTLGFFNFFLEEVIFVLTPIIFSFLSYLLPIIGSRLYKFLPIIGSRLYELYFLIKPEIPKRIEWFLCIVNTFIDKYYDPVLFVILLIKKFIYYIFFYTIKCLIETTFFSIRSIIKSCMNVFSFYLILTKKRISIFFITFIIIVQNLKYYFLSSIQNYYDIISFILPWIKKSILVIGRDYYIIIFFFIGLIKKIIHLVIRLINPIIKSTTFYIFILFLSLVIFIFILYCWISYDPILNFFQKIIVFKFLNFYWYCTLDGLSLVFLFLTSFIVPLCIFFAISQKNKKKILNDYVFCLFCIEILLICVFIVSDLFLFFLFFESILIPFFIMIGLFGTRSRKIHASYLLFFYTLVGSILMMISIFFIHMHLGTTMFQVLWFAEFSEIRSTLLWISFFISFAIKVPMVPFHIWLPEAHVESPTEASVILAALLLKVSGYGFLRILLPTWPELTFYFSHLVIGLCIISIIYSSLSTLRQIDIKRVIAYSSIAHMNVAILGIFTFNPIGIAGSILVMFSHGIVSGGLFFLIGILYNRYKTKIITYYSGVINMMPIYSVFFFIFVLGNIGLPLTCNFIGEFLILYSSLKNHFYFMTFSIVFSIVFCTAYTILLYNKIFFGYQIPIKSYLKDISKLELFVLMPLVFFLFLIGIYPNIIFDMVLFNITSYYYFFF